MKKIFITLVTLISCASLFAEDDDNKWKIQFVISEIVSANPSIPVGDVSFESICNITYANDESQQFLSEQDLEADTEVKAHFAFADPDEYTLVSLTVDDGTSLYPSPVSMSYLNNFTIKVNGSKTYIIKVAKNNYYYNEAGTFVSQYDGTPSGDGLYELDGIDGNKVYGTLAKEIKAGKPYIALPGNHSVILKAQNTPMTDFSGTEYNGFYASSADSKTVAGKDYLIFQSGSLMYANPAGNTVPVGRAYINLKEAKEAFAKSGPKAKSIMLFDDGTGIDNITLGDDSNNGPAYTISGQRVSNPTKGLYIINGKKVLMK